MSSETGEQRDIPQLTEGTAAHCARQFLLLFVKIRKDNVRLVREQHIPVIPVSFCLPEADQKET